MISFFEDNYLLRNINRFMLNVCVWNALFGCDLGTSILAFLNMVNLPHEVKSAF